MRPSISILLEHQSILPDFTSGSVQLNGEKLTDPNAAISPAAGDVLKLSKKHAVRFI